MTDFIIIKPDDIQRGSAYRFSDKIINSLRKTDELFVVGMGNAISLTCTSVARASGIANVRINEVALDYVGIPKLGISGVFFVLDKESNVDWNEKKKEIEKGMNLTFDHKGQLLMISSKLPTERAIPLALSRLADSNCLKISAAGMEINRAASIALELTKSDISRDKLAIALVVVSTVQYTKDGVSIPETVIDVFITKGKKAVSKKHEQILEMLTKG